VSVGVSAYLPSWWRLEGSRVASYISAFPIVSKQRHQSEQQDQVDACHVVVMELVSSCDAETPSNAYVSLL
jgi:hypothetical protein